MKLRWTEQGVADLEHITDYLFEHAPLRAEPMVRKLYDAAGDLLTSPWIGRPGKKEGTREFVLSPLPYIVVYRVTDDVIHPHRPDSSWGAKMALPYSN